MIKNFFFITFFFQISFSQDKKDIQVFVENEHCAFCDCFLINNQSSIFYSKKTDNLGNLSLTDSIYNNFETIKIGLGNGASCTVRKENFLMNYIIKCSKNDIRLESNTLEEVIIFAQKNIVEDQGDKLIYNVDKELTNTAGSSIDILRKSPMVSVDFSGVPSIRGSSNVLVMINNRVIAGLTSSQIIEQIPPSEITKIEVITNPGSKYEAEGTSGIINIITKKKINLKSSGYLNIGLGTKGSHLFSNHIQKINSKWSVSNYFNSLFYYPRNESLQIYESQNKNFEKKSKGNIDGQILSYQMSLSKITNSGKVDINFNYYKQIEELKENYSFNNLDLTDDSKILEKYSYFKVNTDFDNKISEKFKFNFTNSISYMPIKNNFTTNFFNLESESSVFTNIIGLDLESKINKRLIVEIGLKNTSNYYQSKSKNISDEYTFQAKQLLFATYLDNKYKISNKLNLNFGFRYENFDLNDNKLIEKKYSNFFYNSNINFKINNKTTLSFLFGQRTQRPSYSNLLPIKSFLSSNVILEGNPNLNPEFSYNYEIGFSKHFTNSFIKISPFYKNIKNKISNFVLNENDNLFTNYINLLNEENFGLSSWLTLNLFSDKLSLNFGLDVIYKKLQYKNEFNNGTIFLNNINLTYNISEDFYLNLFGNYNSPNIFLQGTENVFTFSNLSLQKSFKKSNIKTGLAIDNPFSDGFKYRQNYNFDNANFSNEILYLNRGIRLLFIFKFGKDSKPSDDINIKENILKNNN